MQQDEPNIELPTLSDEDIHLLHNICTRASATAEPPFKALFSAYDSVFTEEQIEPAHDGVVFRVLMRIGGRVKKIWTPGSQHNYATILRDILEAQGITVVDDDNEDVNAFSNGVAISVEAPDQFKGRNASKEMRRVSFDDARLASSEHSVDDDLSGPTAAEYEDAGLLNRPPKRWNNFTRESSRQKPRSASMDGHSLASDAIVITRGQQSGLDSRSRQPLGEDRKESTFRPRLTYDELVDHAEAFLDTSTIRIARKCLILWRDVFQVLRLSRANSHSAAAMHDHRTLLKQALDIWRERASNRSHARKSETATEEAYKLKLMQKYFAHWHQSTRSQCNAVAVAKVILLKIRYFKRWRALALANAAKVQADLMHKMLNRVLEMTLSRQDQSKVAKSHNEKVLMEKYFHAWYWRFCRNRVEGWNEERIIRFGLTRLMLFRQRNEDDASSARQQSENSVQLSILRQLNATAMMHSRHLVLAETHCDNKLLRGCLHRCAIAVTLKRPEVMLQALVKSNLKRKTLDILQNRLFSLQKARDFNRARLLKIAWICWNDTLRQRALSQRIDERVLVESLYRWVLQERLAGFRSAADQRLVRRVFQHLCQVDSERCTQLESSAAQFERNRQRRIKSSVVVRLNKVLNHREQGSRTAVEFHNDHLIPRALAPWLASVRKFCQYEKWSKDAQLYFSGSKTLKLWKSKTGDQQHQRKKAAYTCIRIKVKKRLAKMCLGRLQEAGATIRVMSNEASFRAQARLSVVCSNAFAVWIYRHTSLQVTAQQASDIDRHRLITSGLTALIHEHRGVQISDDQSVAFRRESDLAVLFSALKRFQWHGFTAHRQLENAEALAVRNQEMHIRQMIRHWALEAQASRLSKAKDVEPESPSLRPASRAASRLSTREKQERTVKSESPNLATPAYMRTPSRPRRATRFKPIPTPAPITPFSFDTAYLATVPNPIWPVEPRLRSLAGRSTREGDFVGLTPQITPFAHKLKAGGIISTPAPALRSSILGRNIPDSTIAGTAKSVRFARGRGSHL